jgi:hypothetical protein
MAKIVTVGSGSSLTSQYTLRSPVIRKGFRIRPGLRESIHLPWFAEQTAGPLVF